MNYKILRYLLIFFVCASLIHCKKKRSVATTVASPTPAAPPAPAESPASKVKEILLGKWLLTQRGGTPVVNGKAGNDSTVISIEFKEKEYTIQYLKTSGSNLWTSIAGNSTETFSGTYELVDEGKSVTFSAPQYVADLMTKWVSAIAKDADVRKQVKAASDSLDTAFVVYTNYLEVSFGNCSSCPTCPANSNCQGCANCTCNNCANTNCRDCCCCKCYWINKVRRTWPIARNEMKKAVDTVFRRREVKALAGLFPNKAGEALISLVDGLIEHIDQLEQDNNQGKSLKDSLKKAFKKWQVFLRGGGNTSLQDAKKFDDLKNKLSAVASTASFYLYLLYPDSQVSETNPLGLPSGGNDLVKVFEKETNKMKTAKILARQALIKNFVESYGVSFANENKQLILQSKDAIYVTFDTSAAAQRKIGTTFIFTKQ